MLRSSHIAAGLVVLVSSGLVALGGCNVIAGIDEKKLDPSVPGGTCGAGAPANPSCIGFQCSSNPDLSTNECACGACPRDCGGAGCENSRCLVRSMVTRPEYTYYVATNGKAVFFPAFDGTKNRTSIHRLEFDANGEKLPQIIADVQGRVSVLVADCDYVYFAISDIPLPTINYVHADGDREQPQELVPMLKASGVRSMAVDDKFVYWSVNDGVAKGVKAWRKGADIENVAPVNGDVTGLVSKDGFLYWADSGPMNGPGKIMRAAAPAEQMAWSAQVVRPNAGRPQGLAVDQSSVYWIDLGWNGTPKSVRKASRDPAQGGILDKPVANVNVSQPPNFPANWLAVDDTYVYFVDDIPSGSGKIARAEKNIDLMKKTILADNVNSPLVPFSAVSLATDNERVYFAAPASMGDNHILWVSK